MPVTVNTARPAKQTHRINLSFKAAAVNALGISHKIKKKNSV